MTHFTTKKSACVFSLIFLKRAVLDQPTVDSGGVSRRRSVAVAVGCWLLAVCTSLAPQWHFNSTSMALKRYFNGTSTALQRNFNGTSAALLRHFHSTSTTLPWHFYDTFTALLPNFHGTFKKMNKRIREKNVFFIGIVSSIRIGQEIQCLP